MLIITDVLGIAKLKSKWMSKTAETLSSTCIECGVLGIK